MKALRTSETVVTVYFTRHNIAGDTSLHHHCCGNLKSHKFPVDNFFQALRHIFFIPAITSMTFWPEQYSCCPSLLNVCYTHVELSTRFASNSKLDMVCYVTTEASDFDMQLKNVCCEIPSQHSLWRNDKNNIWLRVPRYVQQDREYQWKSTNLIDKTSIFQIIQWTVQD
jgi:hypothetical protein